MKKIISLCCGLLLSVASLQAQESLFKEAMKSPRPAGAWYNWTNQKDKMVKLEKVEAYARKHNILLGKYTTIEIGRFGDVAVSLKTLEFLPVDEYTDYIMESILDNTPISSFKSKGSFLYYDPQNKSQLFHLFGDALWTGSLINGRINGQGAGIRQIDPDFYIAFKGLFNEGVPVGKVVYYTYRPKGLYAKYDGKYRSSRTAEMGSVFSEDRIAIRYDMKYGFIDKDGYVPVKPEFDEVTPFHNGVATASIGSIQMEIDKQGKPLRLKDDTDMRLSTLISAKQRHSSLYTAIENSLREHILSYGYDDLVTISKEFPALAETAQSAAQKNMSSYPFPDLIKVETDFPALAGLALERKTALYKTDCEKLSIAYQKVAAAAKENRVDKDDYSIVSGFAYDYGEKYKFDPDNQVKLANEIMDYYEICDAITFNPNSDYYNVSIDPPSFYASSAEHDLNLLTNAWFKCKSVSEDFRSFAEYARPHIESMGNKLNSVLDTQYYTLYSKAFDNAESRAYQTLNSLRTLSDLRPYIKDIDAWKVVEHYDNAIFGGTGKLMDSEQTTVYRFKDGIQILVTHRWDSPGWTSHPKESYFSLQSYSQETLDDCLVKAYKKEKKELLEKQYKKTIFFLRHFPWMN